MRGSDAIHRLSSDRIHHDQFIGENLPNNQRLECSQGGVLINFTINTSTGLITYTGTPTRSIRFNVSFSFKPNSVTPFTTNWYLGRNGGTSSAPDMGAL